jgi:ATP-dependent DNA helicase UvrD/PcrA
MALWRRPARGPAPPTGPGGLLAPLDRDQREAATAPPGPLLVIAGAGAGKTGTLIARASFAVERGGDGAVAIG